MTDVNEVIDRWVEKESEDALLDVRMGGFFRQLADREREDPQRASAINHLLFYEALDALEERVKALESKV